MNAKRFIFLAAICLLTQFAQSQHLNPVSPSGNNAWSFSSTDLYLYQITGSVPPFYWGFWIFGDGEYSPSMMRLHPPDYWTTYNSLIPSQFNQPVPGQYTQQLSATHNYPPGFGTQYNPVCYLIPRKTGPPPPATAAPTYVALGTPNPITVLPSGGGAYNRPPLLPFLTPSGRSIYVEHSHGYYSYANEESVFAITYKPDTCVNGGEVLLFYNSETTINKQPGNPSTLFQYLQRTHVPNYYQPPVAPTPDPVQNPGWQSASTFDGPNSTAFSSQFDNVYSWPFSKAYVDIVWTGSGGVGANGEFRVFPAFSTINNANPRQASYAYVLAILTSKCPIPAYNDNDPKLLYLRGILSNVIPGSAQSNPIKLGSSWVVDADTVFLKSGEPTDPNRLIVTDICPCGNNRYKVTFKLEYCNIGNAPTTEATIHLNPLNNNLSFCRIIEASYGTMQIQPPFPWDGCTNTLHFKQNLPQFPYQIDGNGGCGEVIFTMVVDGPINKLQPILADASVVGGDVLFPGEGKVGFVNDTLSENHFYKLLNKTSPESPPPCPTNCSCEAYFCPPIWVYVVIAIAFVGLILLAPTLYRVIRKKLTKKSRLP